MLAGVSGTNERSESPEMREKGQFVHGNNVPGINSSKTKWVFLGGGSVSCVFLYSCDPSDFINKAPCVGSREAGLEQVR